MARAAEHRRIIVQQRSQLRHRPVDLGRWRLCNALKEISTMPGTTANEDGRHLRRPQIVRLAVTQAQLKGVAPRE
jgi:hypothetical protein